jgi:hypothetical protein
MEVALCSVYDGHNGHGRQFVVASRVPLCLEIHVIGRAVSQLSWCLGIWMGYTERLRFPSGHTLRSLLVA